MKIVTDNGIDLAPERLAGLDVDIVPLVITLGDTHYRGGVDIQSEEFYQLLRSTDQFPTTSQPSPIDFFEVYSELIKTDKNIISIHMSSKLSGTYNAARLGAEQMMENSDAKITVIDSHHVSGTLGWMVEAAAKAAKAGWSREEIISLIEKIGKASRVIFSPETMKYLIHGGRVSNLRGMAATVLNIRPVLQVTYETGSIETLATIRTLKKALTRMVDIIAEEEGEGAALRVQVEHADNPEMAAYVREQIGNRFDCDFLPDTSITPLVGAHTGPGVVAVIYAPQSVFEQIP